MVSRVIVNQAAAGTTQLVAASPGNKHKVLGFYLSASNATGTAQFSDGSGALMGPLDALKNTALVSPPDSIVVVETAINSPLNLVSVGAAFKGLVVYTTEP